MNPVFAIDYCRIVAPERLSDRFLASGVLTPPEGLPTNRQVFLAFVFEITKPWFPSSKVLPTLIGSLEAGYQTLEAGKDLGDEFEEILKGLNQQLNMLSEQGETDWIGNLNGLIIAVGGNELHFSQTGHCPAYLLQKNRIRQITDDLQQERELHPLKTFSNLASGSVQSDDYILISNHELYNEISLDALRRIMGGNTPATACGAIVRELKRERNMAVSSVILKVASIESAAKKIAEPIEIILEEEMQSAWKKFRKRMAPWIELLKIHSIKAGKAGLATAKKTHGLVKTKVAPVANDLLKKSGKSAAALSTQINTQLHTHQPHHKARPAGNDVVEVLSPTKKPVHSLLTTEPVKALASLTPTKLHGTAEKWFKSPAHKRQAALAVAILLIAGTIVTTLSRRGSGSDSSTGTQASEAISQADSLLAKATTAHSLKQDIEASREITDAQKLLNALSGLSSSQQKDADRIWKDLNKQSDLLTGAVRLTEPSTTYTFSTASQDFIANLPYFYGITGNGGSLYRTGSGEESVTKKTFDLPDGSDTIVAIAKSSETDTAGYLLTRKNKAYRVSQGSGTTLLRPVVPAAGEFAPGDALATYNGNLYILDGKTGLLWKYANTGGGYGRGVSMIDNTKYDLKKSLSLAIDGSIYVLKQDGTILKFTSGQPSDFSFKSMPEIGKTLTHPLQVITNESMDNIYVLDAGTSSGSHSTARVVELSKTGSYIRQYAFPDNLTQVNGFDIDPAAKKLWILAGSTVSEFDL